MSYLQCRHSSVFRIFIKGKVLQAEVKTCYTWVDIKTLFITLQYTHRNDLVRYDSPANFGVNIAGGLCSCPHCTACSNTSGSSRKPELCCQLLLRFKPSHISYFTELTGWSEALEMFLNVRHLLAFSSPSTEIATRPGLEYVSRL